MLSGHFSSNALKLRNRGLLEFSELNRGLSRLDGFLIKEQKALTIDYTDYHEIEFQELIFGFYLCKSCVNLVVYIF